MIGAKVKVEKIDVYKVRAEEFANLEVLRAGQLDPGEVRGSWKEVPWLNVEVQQFGVEEPRIDKDGLEYRDIQDELEFLDTKGVLEVGAEVELQVPEFEVEEPRIYKVGRELLDTKDELVCRAAKDDFLQGGGAFDPGEGDCEIGAKGKVVTEFRVAQVKVEEIDVMQGGGARDQGDGDREIGIKEVEELLIGKVEVGGANKDEVVRSGGLDPGEDCVKSVEVKQVDVEVKQDLNGKLRGKFEETRAIKDDPGFRVIKNERQVDVEDVLGFCAAEDDSEFGAIKDEIEYCAAKDAEFELQRFEYEPRRFVTAGCRRALCTNSEYG